jgi:hypothetical protein
MSEPEGSDQEAQLLHRPTKPPAIIRVFRSLKRQRHSRKRRQTEHQRNEQTMARWTRRLGIFTIVLALVSGLTAWILYETDQTSRLRDRAFVYLGNPPITPYPPDKPIVWGVGITVHNAGNMPAHRVVIQYDCPDALMADKTVDPFRLARWKRAEIGNVIGSKNDVVLQACSIPIAIISAARWSKDAKEPEREIFYVAQVTYLDGFSDELRVTQMSRSFRFDQQGNYSLGFAGPHNCSDEDCPK